MTANAALVFDGPPSATPTALVFGDVPAPGTSSATVALAFGPPGLRVVIGPRYDAGIAIAYGLPAVQVGLTYSSGTARPTVGQSASPWHAALTTRTPWSGLHRDARALPAPTQGPWRPAVRCRADTRAPHRETERLRTGVGGRWREAARLQCGHRAAPWRAMLRNVRPALQAPHRQATRAQRPLGGTWRDRLRRPRPRYLAPWGPGLPRRRSQAEHIARALTLRRQWQARHHGAIKPPAGRWQRPGPPVHPPCYLPDPDLLFWQGAGGAAATALLFRCGTGPPGQRPPVVVAVRRAYIVLNSVTLRRVDGNIQLPVYSGSMSLDADSWTWSFSAVLPASTLAHVQREAGEEPVELEAGVNGVPYRLLVLQVGRDREFGAKRIRISGQGLGALLSAPYAPAMNFGTPSVISAEQLANAVLTLNGISIGWGVAWGLSDWAIPAGAWAFHGPYIDAVNDIASAAGGYVQPHATDRTLRILPRYPAAPWHWGDLTADVELPAQAVEVEGTEWVDGPVYNRVFVGGIGAGVFGPVTITGSAGDVIAPQVSHALITAAAAHRQRGLSELARAASRIDRQLELQVLPDTGILVPGTVLDYVDGAATVRGIVRRTQVDWASPSLRQTLGVECHGEPA